MTLVERRTELENKAYCYHLVGNPVLSNDPSSEPDERSEYHQSYIEINGDEVLDKKVVIVVFNDGTAEEVAYWKKGFAPVAP